MIKGKQITICFHVDDCKISNESSEVIDDTTDWLRSEYESIFEDGSGAMKVHQGKVHKYLGMLLDFSHKGRCHVSMNDYVRYLTIPLRNTMMDISKLGSATPSLVQPPTISLLWTKIARNYQMM